MGSVSEMLTAVPLHRRPDLLEACADLINEEWKRSRTSRLHSLQRSTDGFPVCLVLIRTQRTVEETMEGKKTKTQCQLLGHARLSQVVALPNSLFVETVVVAKALRGKGYGRKLMEAVENYAKSRGYKCLHLTTHDKQHFYAHLGYHLSKPVQCAGFISSLVPMKFLESISPSQDNRELPGVPGKQNRSPPFSNKSGGDLPVLPPSASSHSSHICSIGPPVPVAPPLPPPLAFHSPHSQLKTCISSHNSVQSSSSPLSVCVPQSDDCFSAITLPSMLPPPPPPPPPLPPALLGQPNSHQPASSGLSGCKAQGQILLETSYFDLKGQPVFWMEKNI